MEALSSKQANAVRAINKTHKPLDSISHDDINFLCEQIKKPIASPTQMKSIDRHEKFEFMKNVDLLKEIAFHKDKQFRALSMQKANHKEFLHQIALDRKLSAVGYNGDQDGYDGDFDELLTNLKQKDAQIVELKQKNFDNRRLLTNTHGVDQKMIDRLNKEIASYAKRNLGLSRTNKDKQQEIDRLTKQIALKNVKLREFNEKKRESSGKIQRKLDALQTKTVDVTFKSTTADNEIKRLRALVDLQKRQIKKARRRRLVDDWNGIGDLKKSDTANRNSEQRHDHFSRDLERRAIQMDSDTENLLEKQSGNCGIENKLITSFVLVLGYFALITIGNFIVASNYLDVSGSVSDYQSFWESEEVPPPSVSTLDAFDYIKASMVAISLSACAAYFAYIPWNKLPAFPVMR